jgi:glycerol-3-phosphate dehydrogenase
MSSSRSEAVERLRRESLDLAVVGGGITGARVALEAARLGLRVALFESGDFGGGSSSASSKLVHGGFRYLPMGDIGLVRESQHERRVLMERVAPNLVRPLPFLLPVYQGSSRGPAAITTGLLLYRALSGRGGRVQWVSRHTACRLVPALRPDGLRMSGVFDEAETIDSRLVLATVKGAAKLGALVLNHARVIGLELRHNRGGAIMVDAGRDGILDVRARHVVNAAGPWVDRVRRIDDPHSEPIVRLSKGVHLLLPMTDEWRAGVAMPVDGGRVALAIPWQGMLMLGTTDTLFSGDPSDALVSAEDVSCVLDEASRFLPAEMLRARNIRFQVAGLRALPIAQGDTTAARRGHLIDVGRNGMVSVAGGKLTTHRVIACDALRRLGIPNLDRVTPDDRRLPGTGWSLHIEARRDVEPDIADHLERLYGDEAGLVLELASGMPDGLERIHPGGPDVWAQVAYACESEWATTVEDVLRRRTTVAVRGHATGAVTLACEQRLSERRRDPGDERAGGRQPDRAHSRAGTR